MHENPINILLIEDTAIDAQIVQRLLRHDSMPPSVTQWVTTLREAQDLIREQCFDLVLTDLGLPDSSGLETLNRLREVEERLPIIALTGHDEDGLGLTAIRAGANDYIPKDEMNRQVMSRAIVYSIERCRMAKRIVDANRALESKNERLSQMYKMSSQFVDNVSHEFRTPLTVIREFAAIIRDGIDGPVTERQATRLSTLINRTDDLAKMVDDLLDTSRLETGLLKTSRQNHDLAEIVARVERMLRTRAQSKKITLTVEEIPANLTVFCDEEKLRRVLINLVVNAIKFTPVEGRIKISAALADSDRIVITVSDNGPGIATEELTRIFERFQQVEAHHRMASCKGFGLGLSIARALASLNLGSLQVASVEGEGSQFSVLVPVARIDAILNCYLEQRAATLEEDGEISVIEIRPQEFEGVDQAEVLDVIDDFLNSSVKTFDLVLKMPDDRWLLYTCNSESNLSAFNQRLAKEWSKLKRNYYGTALPDLIFTNRLTVNILDGREQLLDQSGAVAPAGLKTLAKDNCRKARVLVVEDEIEVANALESRLTATGFDVTTAYDGQAGLNAVEQFQPDAILLDIRMPVMDGLTALTRLKSNPATASTPVIVLSASLHDKQTVLERGASFFIQKPFQGDAVIAALDSTIEIKSNQSTNSQVTNDEQ